MIYLPTYFGWYRGFLEQRSLRLVTPPGVEPISLDEARAHLRLDLYGSPPSHPDDDILENIYIPAARGICEMISGHAFAPQVFELNAGGWPATWGYDSRIKLGLGPVRGVTSVESNDGTAYTAMDPTGYALDQWTDGGVIYPAYGTTWPMVNPMPNAVRVRFSAGYDIAGASPTDEFPMPPQFKYALLLALGHVYENREDTSTLDLKAIPMGIKAILGPSSLINGFA